MSGPQGRGGKGGARRLKTRVRTARGRKLSSTRWLQRQLNDPYVEEARRQGYRSRAAFKLKEIDERFGFLKPGARVLDLGAAPGGWTQIAVERVGDGEDGGKGGRVVGVDLTEIEPIAGAVLLQLDFLDPEAPQIIRQTMGDAPVDVVLSDMAAPACGHKQTDHLKIMALCEAALDFAAEILVPGGVFLAKVLQGGAENQMLATMKRQFETVRHVKPKASRADSSEMYVLATGFRKSG
ncbi:MAG: rRNA methyltransferase [Hyphomicrobiales bacterium]|nr:MAG: rRNA methyltransferase [Hyphomicrobiales bacterium]